MLTFEEFCQITYDLPFEVQKRCFEAYCKGGLDANERLKRLINLENYLPEFASNAVKYEIESNLMDYSKDYVLKFQIEGGKNDL